jgi:hypothetical protein
MIINDEKKNLISPGFILICGVFSLLFFMPCLFSPFVSSAYANLPAGIKPYFIPSAAGRFDEATIAVLIDRKKYLSEIIISGAGVVCRTHGGEKINGSFVSFINREKKTAFAFAGEVKIIPAAGGGYELINYLKVKDYIACVLISELAGGDYETWRSLAVLIRTMVYKEIIDRSGVSSAARHPGAPEFLICARTHCASYRGVLSKRLYLKALKAAGGSAGIILTHGGAPVYSLYSSACGGKIVRARTIYHALDGCGYFEDKICRCPAGLPAWKNIYGARELSALLGYSVRGIETAAAPYYIVINKKIRYTFDEFISRIEKSGLTRLKSPLFKASYDESGNRFILEGYGLGHCAGLCIEGARVMSDEGADYKKILNYYYKSCILKSVDL